MLEDTRAVLDAYGIKVSSIGSPIGKIGVTEPFEPHLERFENVQVTDAVMATGEVVPAGHGDGELVETLGALRDDGFDGYFSLEPHLHGAHARGGFSGPELFEKAHAAFRGLPR